MSAGIMSADPVTGINIARRCTKTNRLRHAGTVKEGAGRIRTAVVPVASDRLGSLHPNYPDKDKKQGLNDPENQKGRLRARRIRTADLLVPNQAEYLYPIARKNEV